MFKKIYIKLIEKINSFFGLKAIWTYKNSEVPLMAVKSNLGFWYAGNIFDTSDISYGIFRNGIVEKEETELVLNILKLLPENFNFYDVGANTGYYGIIAGRLFNKSTVYSFEPVKSHLKVLKENISINEIGDNVKIYDFALGDENSETKIHLAGSGSTINASFSDAENSETENIKLKRLDDLIHSDNLKTPDFIKIDTEGYELEVLKGANTTLKDTSPILFVEIAYSMKNLGRNYINNKFQETFEYLIDKGYKAYILAGSKVKEFSINERPDGVNMYLFLNPAKHNNILDKVLISNEK